MNERRVSGPQQEHTATSLSRLGGWLMEVAEDSCLDSYGALDSHCSDVSQLDQPITVRHALDLHAPACCPPHPESLPPCCLQDPSKHAVHLCIINLVIGTLYCAKGNFPFGIVRVMKSMEPLAQKLETDTWFYVKRCFLALVEGLTKHMIALPVSDVPSLLLGQGTAGRQDHVPERRGPAHGCPAGVWMLSCCCWGQGRAGWQCCCLMRGSKAQHTTVLCQHSQFCLKVQLEWLQWWCWSIAMTSAQQLFEEHRLLLRAVAVSHHALQHQILTFWLASIESAFMDVKAVCARAAWVLVQRDKSQCTCGCMQDPVLADVKHFLAEAERWGKAIPAAFQSRVPAESGATVAAEARLLQKAFLELLHQ